MRKDKITHHSVYAKIAIFSSVIAVVYCLFQAKKNNEIGLNYKGYMSYITNVVANTEENTNFRKVLFTGARSQLVIMDIPPGGDVGEETHKSTEQTLFFLSGSGKAILDGKESLVNQGDVVVVTPGTKHNFINTGRTSLKIYTIYSPPNHIDGRIHATKTDAEKDVEDETFGETVK